MSLKEKYSITEGLIPASSLIPGQRYQAFDINDMEAKPEILTVEAVMPSDDDPNYYTLSVLLEIDGTLKSDIWKIKPDERIFKKYNPLLIEEVIEEPVEIKPTVKIFGVKKRLNENDTHEYHVSMKPVPRRMQIGDSVIYEKKRGFIVGAYADNWIVQCQFQTFWAKTNQLTSLEEKTEVTGYDQFKFSDKTQELLFEQMVHCGVYMNAIPIKTTNCFVNYAKWKKAKDDDHINILIENRVSLYPKNVIRILEDVNNFANPANYIEGVIVDERTDEAVENVMINVEDYTGGLGDADMVRVLRVDENGEQMTDTLPKAILRTLSV